MRPRAHLGCAVVSLNLRLVFLECRFINLPSQNGRVINGLGVGHQHVYLSCQVLRNDATAIREWRELCFATIESISKRFPSRTFPVTTEENSRGYKSTKLSTSRLGSIRKDQALSRCRKIGVLQRDGRERLDI